MKAASVVKNILKSFFKSSSFIITDEYKKCLEILENSNSNLFITGKAGTGKSTLIQYFKKTSNKKSLS